jgi:hypothetical protein
MNASIGHPEPKNRNLFDETTNEPENTQQPEAGEDATIKESH